MLLQKINVMGEFSAEIIIFLRISGFEVTTGENSENINASSVIVLAKEATDNTKLQISHYRRLGFAGKILLVTSGDIDDQTKSDFYDIGVDGFEIMHGLLARLPARIRSILRVYTNKETGLLAAGNLTYEVASCRTTVNKQVVHLGPTERRLLHVLLQKEGKAYTRDELIKNAWGNDIHVDSRTIDVHVGRLRKVMIEVGVQGFSIDTVRGVGYRGSWR